MHAVTDIERELVWTGVLVAGDIYARSARWLEVMVFGVQNAGRRDAVLSYSRFEMFVTLTCKTAERTLLCPNQY